MTKTIERVVTFYFFVLILHSLIRFLPSLLLKGYKTMDTNKVLLAIAAVLGTAVILFFATILGTFFGAVTGWIVGLFFAETILGTLALLGFKGFTMWQLGATLGFVGAFFKSVQTNNNKDKDKDKDKD